MEVPIFLVSLHKQFIRFYYLIGCQGQDVKVIVVR